MRQIIDYRKDDFLVNALLHTYEYREKNSDNSDISTFEKDFPLEKVIEEIDKYLLASPSIYNGFVEDTYVFKYDNCGRINNKMQNYFKVFCFHNTKNIISLYPVSDCELLPYTDLNYLNNYNKNDISNRTSQTEKFMKRYAKKKETK